MSWLVTGADKCLDRTYNCDCSRTESGFEPTLFQIPLVSVTTAPHHPESLFWNRNQSQTQRWWSRLQEVYQLIKNFNPLGRSRTLLRPRASGTEEYDEDDQDEDRSPSGPSAHHYRRVHPSSLQSECIMQKCPDPAARVSQSWKVRAGDCVCFVSGWFYRRFLNSWAAHS